MNSLFQTHPDFTNVLDIELTPVQNVDGIFVKRDDLFEVAGVCGGKVRTCFALSKGAKGLVTAGSRQSPQVNIVAHIAKYLGIPCHAHTPKGELSPEVLSAKNCGAEIIQHGGKNGHKGHGGGFNSVIIREAKIDAGLLGWTNIPFGMECWEAINQTQAQVKNIPDVKRIVITVGAGMSLAGVLWGLKNFNKNIPVLGIVVGADPIKRLDKYAPEDWRKMVTLQNAGMDYHKEVYEKIGDIDLDPVYEAKCKKFLQQGDLFWLVGIRQSYHG